MSYLNGSPVGELYIGHIKWSNDYKSVVRFNSENARNVFFRNRFWKIENTTIYYDKTYIDIGQPIKNIEEYNYVFFRSDSDISRKYYCAFINDFELVAPDTTRLYIEIDVFQQYFYSSVFYRSYIERAHVDDDTTGKWLAPEPFSVKPEYQRLHQYIFTAADWLPTWVLHSTSLYNITTGEYEYGGRDSGETYGEYGTYIVSEQALKNIVKRFGRKTIDEIFKDLDISVDIPALLTQILSGGTSLAGQEAVGLDFGTSLGDLQDHRNELIGCYAIPSWAKEGSYPTNTPSVKSISFNLPTGRLACGYVPKNNKMYTSLARAFMIYNYAGLKIVYNPDLFTSNSVTVTCSCIPMGVSNYFLGITNYRDLTNANTQISYTCERRIGFDANTGLNKTLNMLGAVSGLATSVGTAGAAMSTSPLAGASAIPAVAQSAVNMVDSLAGSGQIIGSNGELLSLVQGRAMPHFIEVSPLYEDAERIDKYLTQYGYSIMEMFNPSDFFHTRARFNYIKTGEINLTAFCPTRYEEQLKSIFNNGVTIWHDYENFGDYTIDNPII